MKIPGMPHFFMKVSPRGIRSGCRDNGHICATRYSSFSPIQYDSQSPKAAPSDAATHIGQKLDSARTDQRADSDQRAPGRNKQRDKGERFAERQRKDDRYRPSLVVADKIDGLLGR